MLKPLGGAALAMAMLTAPAIAQADVGFDAASYQGCYNAQAAVQAGARFSFIKLSEGTDYVNPYAGCQLNANRGAGMRRGAYHFADVGGLSPQAEADNFINVARANNLIGAGVIPVLDWEPAGNLKAQVWWAKAWLDRVAAAWGTKPLIYMSASTISMADWTPVSSADYGLWVAGYPRGYAGDRLRYPGSVPYSVAPWGFAAAWQYSSSGYVSGVGSAVDVDWFYGDAATWAKYSNAPIDTVTHPATSTPPAHVAPVQTTTTPTGDANALATAVIQGLYGNQPQRQKLLGSRYAEVMAIVNRRLNGAVTSSGSYVVRSGDYLSKVWPQTWPAIAALNGLRPPYTIYAGQTLRTTGAATSTGRRSLVIGRGDSLWAHFGANSYTIARANGIANANRVLAGTRIYY
ncbi:GH25 family lysozyme [Bifidobacterium mongoliense]|uniref:GH25 family lysozyme n=1 Tax=Bifidobacterium mongoliense TaxID=518643 RepID=UPI0030EE8357